MSEFRAFKVTQMEAVERFGFNPPHPMLESRVLKTPADLLERGLPRCAISGVALPKDYPRDPRGEVELDISAMLRAIKEFNDRGEDQILRVGILPERLSLDKLPPTEVFQTLERTYRQLIPA